MIRYILVYLNVKPLVFEPSSVETMGADQRTHEGFQHHADEIETLCMTNPASILSVCVIEAAEGCPARNFEALSHDDMSTMWGRDLVPHPIPCLASEARGSFDPR